MRGYKRCSLPGVGYTPDPAPNFPWLRPIWVTTDFWRSRTGALVVRFSSSQPWIFHFEATLANGKPVPEEAMDDFADFVAAVIYEWGGADDPPDPDDGN